MDKREAILTGAREAAKLHNTLGIQKKIIEGMGFIDIYEVIGQMDIPLLFKDLEGLLGLCLPEPNWGILINKGRPPMMQRFTAAHELGHLMMKHEGSLDRHVYEVVDSNEEKIRPDKEISADAFASEFLLPRWLYVHHFRKQGWGSHDPLYSPVDVYQLSLRVSASYQATAWGLFSHQFLTSTAVRSLLSSSPKGTKEKILGRTLPGNSWSDVWRLTPADDGVAYSLKTGDYISIELPSMTSAGYLWKFDDLAKHSNAFEILDDQHIKNEKNIGAESTRRIVVTVKTDGVFSLKFDEQRPWQVGMLPINSFSSELSVQKPESERPPYFIRNQLVS